MPVATVDNRVTAELYTVPVASAVPQIPPVMRVVALSQVEYAVVIIHVVLQDIHAILVAKVVIQAVQSYANLEIREHRVQRLRMGNVPLVVITHSVIMAVVL